MPMIQCARCGGQMRAADDCAPMRCRQCGRSAERPPPTPTTAEVLHYEKRVAALEHHIDERAGYCTWPRCVRPAAPQRKRCAYHAAQGRDHQQARIQRLRDAGKCVDCGITHSSGKNRCAGCAARASAAGKRRYAAKKAAAQEATK